MTLLRSIARTIIPARYHRRVADRVARFQSKIQHLGFAHRCPVCDSRVRRFLPFGLKPRSNAQCPVCFSLERHRLMWLYFQMRTNLFDGRPKKFLHIAPEREVARRLQRLPYVDYLSADLDPAAAMVQMDITAIQYPDESFDCIYCSHVLNCVPDDRMAMKELSRVLRSGGWAILHVPIDYSRDTIEANSLDPIARAEVFPDPNIVRKYGADYRSRLEQAGFDVRVDLFVRDLDDRAIHRLGLRREEDILICFKQGRDPAAVCKKQIVAAHASQDGCVEQDLAGAVKPG